MGLGKLILLQSAYFKGGVKTPRTAKGKFRGWFESHEGVGLSIGLAGCERTTKGIVVGRFVSFKMVDFLGVSHYNHGMVQFQLGGKIWELEGECDFDARHQKLRIYCSDDGESFGPEMAFIATTDSNQDSVSFDWRKQKISARMFDRRVTRDYAGGQVCYETKLDFIEGENFQPTTGRMLFFIRDVNITFHKKMTHDLSTGCASDYTPFIYEGRQWNFRNAWINKSEPLIPYLYEDFEDCRDKKQTCGAFLETYLQPGEDEYLICKMASTICPLASFAYGTQFSWDSLWKQCEDGTLVLVQGGRNTNLSRHRDYEIIPYSNPAEFVEAIQQEYNQNCKWWRGTLLWYLYAKSCVYVEVKKMIEGMLFDRVSSQFFNSILNQIGLPEVQEMQFGKKKEKLRKQIKEIISLAPLDNTNESGAAFVGFLSKWTDMPEFTSFMGRIEALFDYAGKPLNEAEKELIKYRNGLVHKGEINEAISQNPYDILIYDVHISKLCLLLILSMLGYPNRFQVQSEHFDVSKELPQWDRLKLSTIKVMSAKLNS